MKKVLVLVAVAIVWGGGLCPAFAGEPVIKHIEDALTGNNDYLETRVYVAKTIDLEKVPYAKALNADLRIKVSTLIGEGSFKTGILECGLEW